LFCSDGVLAGKRFNIRNAALKTKHIKQRQLIGHYIFLVFFSLVVLLPFLWIFLSSLKTKTQYLREPAAFPNPIYWKNYADAFKAINIPNLFKNSILISAISVLGDVIIISLAAYVLARHFFKVNKYLYNYFLAGMMIPLNAAIIPLFVNLRKVGLINTYGGVIIPYIAFQIPLGIFLFVNYMKTIPAELEESAIIDGCGDLRLFSSIILPLSRPILATFSIITFMALWNEFMFALVFLTGIKFQTVPLGLATFRGQYETNTTAMLAGAVIAMIPTIIIYICLRRQIMNGMTAGAIKG
jgi:raffinose/stachyose/melibiose transport system permease protein